jgi:hypothetical protein
MGPAYGTQSLCGAPIHALRVKGLTDLNNHGKMKLPDAEICQNEWM